MTLINMLTSIKQYWLVLSTNYVLTWGSNKLKASHCRFKIAPPSRSPTATWAVRWTRLPKMNDESTPTPSFGKKTWSAVEASTVLQWKNTESSCLLPTFRAPRRKRVVELEWTGEIKPVAKSDRLSCKNQGHKQNWASYHMFLLISIHKSAGPRKRVLNAQDWTSKG